MAKKKARKSEGPAKIRDLAPRVQTGGAVKGGRAEAGLKSGGVNPIVISRDRPLNG